VYETKMNVPVYIALPHIDICCMYVILQLSLQQNTPPVVWSMKQHIVMCVAQSDFIQYLVQSPLSDFWWHYCGQPWHSLHMVLESPDSISICRSVHNDKKVMFDAYALTAN